MDGARGAGTPELEVRLLGPLEARRGGEPLSLGGPKPRTLLAALALEPGRVVSVDRLVEALWPGDPPETAAHAIQVYVSQLRKALGPVITTRAPGYELELAPERVDLHRFTRLAHEGRAALDRGDAAGAEAALREALGLWRGPALADFLYEPFTQTDIARLEDLRTVVLEERIEADLGLGRHAELVSELEALVQAQPLRERPRAQLMLALYRSGRQADALAAYRVARETLVEELGIEPGPELRELEAAILRQDDSLLLRDGKPPQPALKLRRFAAIVSVDLVDSMALGDTLDAETLADVERQYVEAVSDAITSHGGAIEAHVGDIVTAAFGVSVAHEDDALRAARAAIDLRATLGALDERLTRELRVGLRARIGIAAGDVVATLTGSGQRILAGDPVRIAATLQHAAQPGEIVVNGVAARLIDHAARLRPHGSLDIPGRSAPQEMFLLREVFPPTPAFESRLDAPLVGRKRELAALRRSLKRAVDAGSSRVALVVAPPGVGKSRLAAEFTRRAKGVGVLWGRCLPYGDGITYWPLREALAGAAASRERDAVLAGLEAGTTPPVPELAWLFRRFCEASARERPLVLVVDDAHWGEPTFLELLEHLADHGAAPIQVVCLAREELEETHPTFLEGRANVDRIAPGPLSVDETSALADALGGSVLQSDQRTRLLQTAEGNPLFLEQLLALALEGGLGDEGLPETIQALLAARLDRLGPGERAVLERGAIVGKEFTAEDVVALLEPSAAATAETHLAALVDRGFVRPRGDRAFGFRHVLVQDAVYRSAPKRLRAELHERYADRLDSETPDLPDLDEFVGYHLERSHRLRTELGETDRRVDRLAEDGGRRLGEAGIRALKRGDVPATTGLIQRATTLVRDPSIRCRLLAELAIALLAEGQVDRARLVLEDAIRTAEQRGDRPAELRARTELAYLEIDTQPGTPSDGLLALAEEALPVFETIGDDRAAGRTWLYVGFVRGSVRGRSEVRVQAAEQALSHYQRCGWPIDTAVGEIVAGMYFGPTEVVSAIARCEQLLAAEPSRLALRANVEEFLAGFVAERGEFSRARELLSTARDFYADLGQATSVAGCDGMLGDVELLAGDAAAAESVLAQACRAFEALRMRNVLATKACHLAEALWRQEKTTEALGWTLEAERLAAPDDLGAQSLWRAVRGKILAGGGDLAAGEALSREAVEIVESTDNLNRRASVHASLGETLGLAGQTDDSRAAFDKAAALYSIRGNLAAVEFVATLEDTPQLV